MREIKNNSRLSIHIGIEDAFIVLFIRLAGDVKVAAENKVEEAKEAGAQLADDASKKVDEVKAAAQETTDQAKEAGAQLAADASNAAEQTKNTVVDAAIHAKDAVIEKAQEIGAAVSIRISERFVFRMTFVDF